MADHQAVKTGDVIALIDTADFVAKERQAKAERDAAKAQSDAAEAQITIVEATSRGGLGAARAALSSKAASVMGGQPASVTVDGLPGRTFHAALDSRSYGTGPQFSLLPPDNASGNFVKVVQRVPVKLLWTDLPDGLWVASGLSADVTVDLRQQAATGSR